MKQAAQVEKAGVPNVGLSIGLVVLGVLIGVLWPRGEKSTEPTPADVEVAPQFVEGADTGAVMADLPVLAIKLDEAAARRLTAVRENALERGLIVQGPDDMVPAILQLADGAELAANLRIKGDWTDHVEGNRWSFRVELAEGRLLGMRVFSIQDPKTRGHLWEWLVHRAMRRVGVLAPRSSFVNVAVNGNAWGVYYLEEHFSKELLESQGRREGPIVLWDESALWAAQLQAHHLPPTGVAMWLPDERPLSVTSAFPRAYGEKRLGSVESLSNALDQALVKLDRLSDLVLLDEGDTSRLRQLEAIERLQGETVERIANLDLVASHHAVASLFQLEHPLVWHNMRFYFDPVRDRLEPISFDNMAHEPGLRDPAPKRAKGVAAVFASSPRYNQKVYAKLAEIASPDWLGRLFIDAREELERFERALGMQAPLGPEDTIAGMEERLIRQAGWLSALLSPIDPLQADARYWVIEETVRGTDGASVVSGFAHVDLWTSLDVPLEIVGVRFSNGNVIPAVEIAPETAWREGDSVLLSADGRRLRLEFRLDHRLANLSNLESLLRSVQASESARDLDLGLTVLWRTPGSDNVREEPLRMRRRDANGIEGTGRPAPPSVSEALARHPFLSYAFDAHDFETTPGEWDVEGDLVLPEGASLSIAAGTTLRFGADNLVVVNGAVNARGTVDAPVVLEPQASADRFRGVVVLDADERSLWTRATVRRTDAVFRGGWQTTGGVTFYHSPVTMRDVAFEKTFAEDGLNLFGCDIELVRCTFDSCASDSMDGDFVTGTLRQCRFTNGLADGADFSGSDVTLEGCVFLDLADKALSVGEDSVVRMNGGRAERVNIGVASKDRSRTVVRDFVITDAKLFGLAAFIKKPEYGASQLLAERVTVQGRAGGKRFIAQTGCRLIVDGQKIEEEPLDVEALYREQSGGR